jgi:hypothetical protein
MMEYHIPGKVCHSKEPAPTLPDGKHDGFRAEYIVKGGSTAESELMGTERHACGIGGAMAAEHYRTKELQL